MRLHCQRRYMLPDVGRKVDGEEKAVQGGARMLSQDSTRFRRRRNSAAPAARSGRSPLSAFALRRRYETPTSCMSFCGSQESAAELTVNHVPERRTSPQTLICACQGK